MVQTKTFERFDRKKSSILYIRRHCRIARTSEVFPALRHCSHRHKYNSRDRMRGRSFTQGGKYDKELFVRRIFPPASLRKRTSLSPTDRDEVPWWGTWMTKGRGGGRKKITASAARDKREVDEPGLVVLIIVSASIVPDRRLQVQPGYTLYSASIRFFWYCRKMYMPLNIWFDLFEPLRIYRSKIVM